jgi:hypothetical protein
MRPIRHDKETAVKPPPTVMRQAFHAWLLEKHQRLLPKSPLDGRSALLRSAPHH